MICVTREGEVMSQKDIAILYAEALKRLYEKHLDEEPEGNTMLTQQIVFLNVKTFSNIPDATIGKLDRKMAKDLLREYFKTVDLVSLLTPRQFIQTFPVAKDYDSDRWQTKDYFFTMEEVEKIGMDNVIGEERAYPFLMEYWSRDIINFIISGMEITDRIMELDGLPSMMEQFLADQGIYGHTYYEEEGIMVDHDGKVMKVQKPKRRVPKYIRVPKGGKH